MKYPPWHLWFVASNLLEWRTGYHSFAQPSVAFHIETSYLFGRAKQMPGFYMKSNTGLKCVKNKFTHKSVIFSWLVLIFSVYNLTLSIDMRTNANQTMTADVNTFLLLKNEKKFWNKPVGINQCMKMTLKAVSAYIFATFFFKSKREHLSN